MKRIASLTLVLMLSACGYKTWWNPPFVEGFNPNLPATDSENMRRVQGLEPSEPVLTTEAGDIWPGPLKPPPTLQDMEAGVTSQPEAPKLGSPLSRRGQTSDSGAAGSAGGQPASTNGSPASKPGGQSGSVGQGTANTPGGQSIVVPNGNGTSTVIHADGRVETVPTAP